MARADPPSVPPARRHGRHTAGIAARGRTRGVGSRARRFALLWSACAAAVVLVGCGDREPTAHKVAIVGIDGADWAVIDRLRAASRLPTLGRLIDRGTRGPLATLTPTLSPALWTTIATGQPPNVHGIANFVTYRPHAEVTIPSWPGGEADVVLPLHLDGCGRDALVISADGSPVAIAWNGDAVKARVSGAPGATVSLAIDLRAPCQAPAAGNAWGSVGPVTVRAPSGQVIGDRPPETLASAERGVQAPTDAGGRASLVGRRLAQVESGDRRVPALWDIAGARDRSVGVVGWWCTWPAERVRGTMISDFLFFASTRRLLELERVPEDTLRAGAVYPPEAARLVAAAMPARWELSAEELGRFVPASSPRFGEYLAAPSRVGALTDPPIVVLKDTYLLNRPYFAVARQLATSKQPDFLLVYTNLVDAVEHKFWRYYEPARFAGVSPADVADFGETIPRSYEYVDDELGRLLGALASDTVVVVLSDHGHHAAPDGGVFSGEHHDAPPGILIVAGPGIRHGEVGGASLQDVTPTVLAAAGLPVARDFPGRVLPDVFATPPTPATVATYRDVPREATAPSAPSDVDPAVRERLRALGYLQ